MPWAIDNHYTMTEVWSVISITVREAEMDATEQETEKRVFEYLDGLRESGSINMFGAAPYVEEEFGVPRAEARKLVTRWMGTFGERR